MAKDVVSCESFDTEETAAKLADLINYFQTTPTLNYGKYEIYTMDLFFHFRGPGILNALGK
jgi:hypothetical protein